MIQIQTVNQRGPIVEIYDVEQLIVYLENNLKFSNYVSLSDEIAYFKLLEVFSRLSGGKISKSNFNREVLNVFGKDDDKKLSVLSNKYWTLRGYSEFESQEIVSKIQKERSPRNIEYWKKKGFNSNVSKLKVKEFQTSNGKIGRNGESGVYQLDHRFSQKSGVDLSILPFYIGHEENLEYIKWEENRAKSSMNSISLEILFRRINERIIRNDLERS